MSLVFFIITFSWCTNLSAVRRIEDTSLCFTLPYKRFIEYWDTMEDGHTTSAARAYKALAN